MIELFTRAQIHDSAIALTEGDKKLSYRDLLDLSGQVASVLLDERDDLKGERIAYYMPGSHEHVMTMWGIWRAGGIAIPLNVSSARSDLEHVLINAGVNRVIVPAEYVARIDTMCEDLGIDLLLTEDMSGDPVKQLPQIDPKRAAMMLFTSGTTNKPKGVVTTHDNIESQITTLVEAWGWRQDDRIPLFLPLHHIHGIINVLSCALWTGATVDLYEKFDLESILERVSAGNYTVFMAVPTIYVKLIRFLDETEPETLQRICDGFGKMRLMISGSAALPASIHEHWQNLTGQVLLERYGMTEIGMGISNPLNGERRPGAIGQALPGVSVRLVSESGDEITEEDTPGEIWVKGRSVFREYWQNPKATEESFSDGWFKTGDMAVKERGYYRILGRLSVDIIKSGGEKLSALEIEDALLIHETIAEVAVVGIPDETWGEAVAAMVTLKEGADLNLAQLKEWASDKLTNYKIPKHLMVVEELPRNAMGKVTKPAVKEIMMGELKDV